MPPVMTKLIDSGHKIGPLKRVPLFFLVLNIMVLSQSCTEKHEPYRVVRFYGNSVVMNYSKEFDITGYQHDKNRPAVMLLEKGDLIGFDEIFYHYNDASSDSISFRTDDKAGYINGRIHAIVISEKDTACTVLNNIINRDISSLEMIYFSSRIDPDCIPLLEKIAKARPDVSLIFDKPFNGLNEVIKLFRPKIISISDFLPSDLSDLNGQIAPEILILKIDSSFYEPLPAIPSLKKIILLGESDVSLSEGFLAGNPQIESLVFSMFSYFDFEMIKPLSGLKALLINTNDSLANAGRLKSYKSLEMLGIISKGFSYESNLKELNHLRWVIIPPDMEQTDFNAFILNHLSLEVVEIVKNKNLTDLKSLLSLDHLQGLTIVSEIKDSTTFLAMKNLKYLSLPSEFLGDSLKFNGLKGALPNTVIAANEGFCLGSGWLLLLIPLIALFRYFSSKRRN
jgi:hypothetical protein